MGWLVQSMLDHMMEAQALATWLLLEITTTGRLLAWTSKAEKKNKHSGIERVCVYRYVTADTHLNGTVQASELKLCHKID